MRVVTDLTAYDPPADGAVVTIGAYDGVHLGHQEVLRLVRELADARGHEACCLTFDRHPAEVVRPESAPKLLTSLEQKLELLDATGSLDTTCVLTFDEARSKEPAEDFVRDVLVGRLGARLVIVGADFHFGHRRHGNVRLLEQMGAELGFEVLGLGLVPIEGDAGGMPYSSTRIRQLLAAGRVADAARLSPAHPGPTRSAARSSWATAAGASSGSRPRTSRCPPACACPPTASTPARSSAEDGIVRPATLSLGRRPTFYEEAESLLEAYVLDFDGDLYGQHVQVRFVERLHGEERFDSVDALVEQMHRDVARSRQILGV